MPNDPGSAGPVAVDIWNWSLDQSLADVVDAHTLLSGDEQGRAQRFLKDVDRRRYIVGRTGLRRILATYLGIEPRAVRFGYNNWGKPELDLADRSRLHFNLSHSAGEAMLAVSAHTEVGIDIEEIRPLEEDIASHFFSGSECAALAALSGGERLVAFYRCWTRKEAFVKAHGAGLSVPLDSFDVSLEAVEGQHLLERLDRDVGRLADWALLNLDVVDGFCGALAVSAAGRDVKIHYRSRSAWSANMASMM
ncbi:4'-phosphopantetheinyl transferase superfamily protein [Rhizobium sp. WL3]|uniref:4'-phosphopantetheinyl transferase family protein n=1 Tax=Rhizobium sp. WL3 TaxID=2603277 RepID=UPI001FEFC0D6|nr:4'-phosphopantetheinyl transferase superfamily protein [Rhizobium sp. WL3]